MKDTTLTGIDGFREELKLHNTGFVHTAPPQDECAHIRFIGTFDNKPVIWNATIMTNAHYSATVAAGEHEKTVKQFIDIGYSGGDVRDIEVCLDLNRIDEQVLLKTIIMVRKYKLLHTGRHNFGYSSRAR